ncbi:MAG: CoA transferase [Hyphomicrobiaceae bacterium]
MQAFDGIKVLDLTHVLAGPFSTYQLAVLGADVIKIESAGLTDMNREIGPILELNAARMGSHYQSQGANKRAMTLNLKTDEGRNIFMSLARDADVIVENYRTGVMDRLGLGYDQIRAINPDIIYCSITGFGQTGPKRGHGAFDNVIQAFSGMMMATGPRRWPGCDDRTARARLRYRRAGRIRHCIGAARRERTGEGQRLDVAMLDAALMLMSCNVLNHAMTGASPDRSGIGRNYVAAYGCYDAADTQLMIGVFRARPACTDVAGARSRRSRPRSRGTRDRGPAWPARSRGADPRRADQDADRG